MATRFHWEAIGTHWQIDLATTLSVPVEASVQAAVRKVIADYDQLYSRFRVDSLVRRMASQAGRYHLPEHARDLFGLYHQLYHCTAGAFTPLIGRTLEQAGYDAQYSLQSTQLEIPPTWETVIDYQAPDIVLKQPAVLDFGAGGKGQLVDLVAATLEQFGISDYCIDAGGDIRQRSAIAQSLRVGLEDPMDTTKAIGVVELANQSICGSAGNRRAWGQYHHILNPHTLQSPRDIAATWVVADTTLLADALATALYFVQPEQLQSVCTFEYVLLRSNYQAEISSNFPGEVFKF
jgi:thiamine biosynthesis lipoprotein